VSGDVTKTNPKNKEIETKMQRFMNKKRLVTAGIVGTLLVGGAVAFATIQGAASGGGSGGTTGGTAPNVPVTISVTIAATPALVPGGAEVPVTFDVGNASTTQSALVTSISQIPVTVKNGTGNYGPVSSSNTACQAVINGNPGQFWLTPIGSTSTTPVTVMQNTLVGPNVSDQNMPSQGQLSWASTAQVQNACLGQPLTLWVTTP
jgi:hypothetical protein